MQTSAKRANLDRSNSKTKALAICRQVFIYPPSQLFDNPCIHARVMFSIKALNKYTYLHFATYAELLESVIPRTRTICWSIWLKPTIKIIFSHIFFSHAHKVLCPLIASPLEFLQLLSSSLLLLNCIRACLILWATHCLV